MYNNNNNKVSTLIKKLIYITNLFILIYLGFNTALESLEDISGNKALSSPKKDNVDING